MRDNWVEIWTKDGRWFGLRFHYANDAKAFAKWLWDTGTLKGVCVANKKEQVVFQKGEITPASLTSETAEGMEG